MKLITVERYESGSVKSLTLNLIPVILGVTLIYNLGWLLTIYLGVAVWTYRMLLKTIGGHYPDSLDYVGSIFFGLIWPVGLFFALLTREDCRYEFTQVFANKYFYLRNPFVLKKMEDEDPNKAVGPFLNDVDLGKGKRIRPY